VKHVHRDQDGLLHRRTPYHGYTDWKHMVLWHHRRHHWDARFTPWTPSWFVEAMCIHEHESTDWHIFNPPYAGGMQMNSSFQVTYGARYWRFLGTADHWTPHEQLLAAYHGWLARGWEPWSTRYACGL
jgi:hypothetical protein